MTRLAHPAPATLPTRRQLTLEVWVVFGLSLGADGLSALVSFVGDLTAGRSLASQSAVLNGTRAPGRPTLDLAFQLVAIATTLVPVVLAGYLLVRSGESVRTIGLDLTRPGRDLGVGALLAAVIGGSGLALYLATHALGVNLKVVAEALPPVWWRIPVLVLAAVQNGLLEESLVVGYLLHRLDQLGWSRDRSLLVSSLVRGSYHLYQGGGGFLGNFVMGLVFGRFYQLRGRVMPLVVAHTLIDAVAFIGYALLAGHVSWLPSAVR